MKMGQDAKILSYPPSPRHLHPGRKPPHPPGQPFRTGAGEGPWASVFFVAAWAMLKNNQWFWPPEAAPAGPGGGAFGLREGQFGSWAPEGDPYEPPPEAPKQ